MSLAETIGKYRNYLIAFLAFILAAILSFSARLFQGLSLGAIGPNNLSINFILSGSLSVISGWLIVHESAKQTEGNSRVSGTYMAIGTVAVIALMGFTSGLGRYQGYEGLLGLFAPLAGYLIEEVKDLSKEMYASYTQTPASMNDYKEVSEMIDTSGSDEGTVDVIESNTKKKGVNKTEKELHKLAEDAEEVRKSVKKAAEQTGDQKIARIEREIASNMEKVKKAVQDNKQAFEKIQKEVIKVEENPRRSQEVKLDLESGHQEILQDLKTVKQAITESEKEIEQISESRDISMIGDGDLKMAERDLSEMANLFQDLKEVEDTLLEAEETETQQLEKFEQLWERNE